MNQPTTVHHQKAMGKTRKLANRVLQAPKQKNRRI